MSWRVQALTRLPVGEEWKLEGSCKGTDPDAFFPETGDQTRLPKRICRGCPVRQRCLDFALDNNEQFGIWGMTTPRERRRLKRAG